MWRGYCNYAFCQALWWRSRPLSALRTTQPPTIQSVIGEGEQRAETTLSQSTAARWPLLIPSLSCKPATPSPQLCDDKLSWKNDLFCPFLDLLQISCSVCGPGFFLCSEAWIPDRQCLAAQRNSSTVPRPRRHITGCCCCHPCRSPPTYSFFPWIDPRGSPHPCGVACARWCDPSP